MAGLLRGLGLTDEVEGREGSADPDRLVPIEGILEDPLPAFLSVRPDGALYRFHGRGAHGLPVAAGHHSYSGDVGYKGTEKSWRSWLDQAYTA